jgi:hypothetical protein
VSAHLEKLPALQLSRTASVQLPPVIRVLHLTLQRVDLKEKKSDHQMAIRLILQLLDNRQLVNQRRDSQQRASQTPDNQLNKVQC